MKRAGQTIVFLLCVVFSVASAVNVFSDNTEVERMAAAVACGEQGPNCRAQVTRLERTPFGQTFGMQTSKRSLDVVCRRSAIMVGEYNCKLR